MTPPEIAGVEVTAQPTEVAKPRHWRQGPEDEKPFMWASKTALKQIVESPYIDLKELPTALIVYWTLCWLASDNESNTFEASQGLIAKKCGLHKNTVKNRMSELEKTGVVVVTRRRVPGKKEWDVNIYRLTSASRTIKVRRKTPNVQGSDKENVFPLSHCRKDVVSETHTTNPINQTTDTPSSPASAFPLSPASQERKRQQAERVKKGEPEFFDKLKAIPKDSEEGKVVRQIWIESGFREKPKGTPESEAFAKKLYDSIIEAGANLNKEQVLAIMKGEDWLTE